MRFAIDDFSAPWRSGSPDDCQISRRVGSVDDETISGAISRGRLQVVHIRHHVVCRDRFIL